MAEIKDIVKLAVDGYKGKVEKYSVGQSQELLRQALIEANGGSTVLDYKKIRDGKFTITALSNGWGKLKSGAGWIYLANASYCTIGSTVSGSSSKPAASNVPYKVRVDASDLRIRSGAGTNYPITGKYTGKGTFTIVEEKAGTGSTKGWGKLKSGAGWISLDYCVKL